MFCYICAVYNGKLKVQTRSKSAASVWLSIALAWVVALVMPLPVASLTTRQQREMLNHIRSFAIADSIAGDSLIVAKVDSLLECGELSAPTLYGLANMYGRNLFYQGKQATGVKYHIALMNYLNAAGRLSSEDTKELLHLYVCIGASLEELGMKGMAMDYYVKGLNLATSPDYDSYRAMLMNNIGVVYIGVELYDKAIEYLTEAVEINKRAGNNDEIFLNYNNLSGVYEYQGDIDRAVDCSLKALSYIDSDKNAKQFYFMQVNMGMLYSKKGNYEIAASYLNNAIKHLEREKFVPVLIDGYISLANVHIKTNRLDSARIYNAKALSKAEQSELHSVVINALRQQAQIAKATGDLAQATAAMERAYAMLDSIQTADNKQRMAEWENIYEITLRDGQDNASTIPAPYLIVGGAALALVAVGVAMAVGHRRHRDKARRLLGERDAEIADMRKQLDQRNRQLTTYTLDKLKTNEYIEDVSEDLRGLLQEINPRDKGHKAHIQEVLKKLTQFNSQDSWQEFRCYFELVHPRFYQKLDEMYPDLTLKEKRLCAFLALELSTKDIASLTFREVRSVESSRNRLRKKMGITTDDNLVEVLQSITFNELHNTDQS